jgi:hypothetical protein
MSNFQAFSPDDLQKVGIVCKTCKTEVVYDLDSSVNEIPSQCPVCQPEPFGGQPSRALDWYRKLRKLDPNAVRLYFRKPQTVETETPSSNIKR